jgi:hypothetical protein
MKPEKRIESPAAGWRAYLREFSGRNAARLTRLGVIKADGVTEDFWLEDGLPLVGVDIDTKGNDAPLVEIMLGARGEAGRSMTHAVRRVRKVGIKLAADGSDEGLDVEDGGGVTTVLRFEPRASG